MSGRVGSGGAHAIPQQRRTRRPRLVAALVVLLWLAVSAVGGPLVGRLAEVQKNDNASFVPATAESTEVADFVQKASANNDLPYLLVLESPTAITPAQQAAAAALVQKLPAAPLDKLGPGRTIGEFIGSPTSAPIPSQDGKALLVVLNLDNAKAEDTINKTTPLYETALELRTLLDTDLKGTGLTGHVAGPGGLLSDFVTAFEGIDGVLLLVALVVVLLILLVVYRSPILPFAVLISAVFGLALAALAVFPLAKAGAIDLSGQSQGIMFILVVGAATDYALLLVSRFREALHDTDDTWDALRSAWRGAVEPILASGATVILGLLCLMLSDLGSTAGLGPVGALGIAGAMAASLTFLPAVLLLVGRRIFWPVAPKLDHRHLEDALETRGVWGRVAKLVGTHPRRTWVITLAGLLAFAAFIPTFKADGLSADELFLTEVPSVEAGEALARHYPAGAGSPVQIVVPQPQAEAVVERLRTEADVQDPYVGLVPGAPPVAVDGKHIVQATLAVPADSPEATEVVRRLRADLDAVTPDALVGGSTAVSLDVLDATERDLRVIIPAILIVIFIVLALLLRSLVAPVLLVVANVVSFAATVGVAALVFNHILDFPNSDPATPLYGFVFLVALGIDYSIFLMTRVREEAQRRGTRPGILTGLAVTGGVITSAGIVLAATFSALAVLPLIFLVQIGFIVAFGVLLDTLIVRSLLVPALAYDIGPRIWAPSRLAREDAAVSASTGEAAHPDRS
ncbi:MMPL family transporter [Nostocoides australiense]|nr:MMPL family transporter [Tetrasphaera australiensis]